MSIFGGGGLFGASPSKGMAYWMVTEPIPNVWIQDRPFWYRSSRGGPIELTLTYKGRLGANGALDSADTNMFSVGTNWFMPWRSYVEPWNNGGTMNYFVSLGDGTLLNLALNAYTRGSSIQLTTEDGLYVIKFPSGKKHIYGTTFEYGALTRYLLSATVDAQTNRLDFTYSIADGLAKLTNITDFDGNQITFEYTNSTRYPALISKIVGPYNLTNYFTYNTNGQLTQIKDVIGLTSGMQYDTSNRVSHLITSYGTNRFNYLLSTNGAWQGIQVAELDVRKHFYLYGIGPTNILPSAYDDYVSLSQLVTNTGMTETFKTNNFHERSSYYWGPRQFANLPIGVRTNIDNNTFDISLLTTNNYNIGRLRHWLTRGNANTNFTMNTLALEREPSPDAAGNSEGLIIWYDYQDKISTQPQYAREREPRLVQQPKFIAYKVGTVTSGGNAKTNWYVKYTQYNNLARPTMTRETYGEPTAGTQLWRTNIYTYAANGTDLETVVQNGIGVLTNLFNGAHRLVTNYNALGEMTTFTYNEENEPLSLSVPNGLTSANDHHGDGRVAAVTESDANGNPLRTNSYTYANGLVQTQTDERGLTITNQWDALGRLLKVSYPDGTFVSNVYVNLDIVRTVDRMGFSEGFAYDGFRNLIRYTNANQKVTIFTYCDCGSLESITDPLNNITSYTYDNAGRQARITFPGNSYTDFVYDYAGRVLRTLDSAGVSITNYYTVDSKVFSASNAFGRLFYRSLNDHDQTAVFVDRNGVTNWFTHDVLGRVLEHIHKVNEITPGDEYQVVQDTYEYAANIPGPVAKFRESKQWLLGVATNGTRIGRRLEFAYDALGRKTNEVHVDLSGNPVLTIRGSYSAGGNLVSLTDGKAQVTSWKVDQYGRMTNKVHSGSEIYRLAYDANGRMTNRWTPAKGITVYTYDNVGNLTSINHPASTDIAFGYDGNDRITNMVDAVGTTRYRYTAFGSVETEDGPWENDTVTYSYDSGQRRSSLSIQAPNASTWNQSYTYDAANRLSTLSSPAGAFTYGYHAGLAGSSPASLVKSVALPNTSAITNNYDTRGRMLGTWLRKNNGTLLNKHEYQLNDLDQRTKQTRTAGDYVDYAYDPLGQLTNAVGKELGGVTNRFHEQFAYRYDAAGNLTNRVQHRLTNSFTVNSLNQLTGGSRGGRFSVGGTTTGPATNVTVNTSNSVLYLDYTFASTNHSLVNGTNTFTAIGKDNYGRIDTNIITAYLPESPTYAYDANGNLTYDGVKAFTYDDENQLTQLTASNAWKSEFTYDGQMRRRIRREFTWQNGAWLLTNEVRYIYDISVVVQERDSFNTATVSYTRGSDRSGTPEGAGGIGGLLAFSRHSALGAQHSYYHSDGNGNVCVLVGTNQSLEATYCYDPFGAMLSMSGPLAAANLYRFSSKEVHEASRLTCYLYRYYDPNLQRWVTRDPIEEDGDMNLYRYVKSAPIDSVDAFGLYVLDEDGFPLTPTGTALDSYFYDEETAEEHEEIMDEAAEKVKNAAEELASMACPLPGGPLTGKLLGRAGKALANKIKGSYKHVFKSGKEYIGKGTANRMRTSGAEVSSANKDKLVGSKFEASTPNTDKQAFIDEAEKIRDAGGVPNPNLYNKINSPGEKYLH